MFKAAPIRFVAAAFCLVEIGKRVNQQRLLFLIALLPPKNLRQAFTDYGDAFDRASSCVGRDRVAQQRDHFFTIAGLRGENSHEGEHDSIIQRTSAFGFLYQGQRTLILAFGVLILPRRRIGLSESLMQLDQLQASDVGTPG